MTVPGGRPWLAPRLDPAERYGLRLTLFVVGFVLVAVPFGWLLAQIEQDGSVSRLDTTVAADLHGWARRSSAVVEGLRAVTNLGAPWWLWAMTLPAVAFVWHRDRHRLAIFLAVTTLGGGLLNSVVKLAVDRPRPSFADPITTAAGKSFPSGHAMSSTVVYGALLVVFLPVAVRRGRRLATVALAAVVALVAAICFSRLALGVHYVSDVLGGVALGLAWLCLSVAAFSTWREDRGLPPVEPLEGLEPEAAADLS